ncbi:MAG TPA: tetratricopeptide repeat protein [bacterium]|nr:tetratricopeptide repeat protein [bacterium]
MARHEFGLSVQSSDPLRAAALFEEAIARDPTYVPPYFSFARLSLHLGLDGEGLFQRLKSLLAKAPRKKELLRLKARVDGVSRGR